VKPLLQIREEQIVADQTMGIKARILTIGEEAIKNCFTMKEAIEVNRQAFISLSLNQSIVPQRIILSVPPNPMNKIPNGSTLFKPAYAEITSSASATTSIGLGLKVVSVRPENGKKGLQSVEGIILLQDEVTGLPTAILDATYLTALRTGAGSGAATEVLALKTASNLVVFGAGAQVRTHLDAMFAVRSIKNVHIWNRTPEKARALIKEFKEAHGDDPQVLNAKFAVILTPEEVSKAVKQADIIVTATNTDKPLFNGKDLKPGAHINAIGSYLPNMQELDEETVRRALTISDNPKEEILTTAGDYLIPLKKGIVKENCIVAQIGDVLSGKVKIRSKPEDDQIITIFKSVGNAVQDVATAKAIYDKVKNMNSKNLVGVISSHL